jgi:hypothetical protein
MSVMAIERYVIPYRRGWFILEVSKLNREAASTNPSSLETVPIYQVA